MEAQPRGAAEPEIGRMSLEDESPAALIFSCRQVRQRQPADGVSAAGMGMTCGNSAHQQPPSGWQFIGALHWLQRVSTGNYGSQDCGRPARDNLLRVALAVFLS